MYRTNSNPSRPQRRRSFKGWLKRMTLPNNQRRIEPQVKGLTESKNYKANFDMYSLQRVSLVSR